MLIRKTLLYMPAQLLAPLLQFAAAVLWTHYMGAAEYGLFAMAVAAQELADSVFVGWWSQATLRYLGDARGHEARARYAATETATLTAALCLHGLAAVALVAMTDAKMDVALAGAVAAFAVTKSLSSYLAERARADGRIGLYTFTQLVSPGLGLLCAWLAVSYVAPGAASALWGYAAAQAIGAGVAALSLGVGRMRARPSAAIVAQALRYGLPLVAAGALAWVAVNGVRLVVERHGTLADVGLLSVGWGLGLRLSSVAAMMFAAAAFPHALERIRAGAKDEAMADLALNGALLFGLLAPMCTGLFFIARPLVELMVAPGYQAAAIAVMPAAALAGAARNWRVHFVDHAYLLVARTGVLTAVCAAEALFVLAGCVVGYAQGGVSGAAWGAFAGVVGAVVVGLVVGVGRFSLRVPLGDMARVAFAVAAMSAVLALEPFARWAAAPRLVADVALGACVYALALLLVHSALRRLLFRVVAERRALPAAVAPR